MTPEHDRALCRGIQERAAGLPYEVVHYSVDLDTFIPARTARASAPSSVFRTMYRSFFILRV